MADERDPLCAAGVEQRSDVFHQTVDTVVRDRARFGLGLPVAAEVGGPDAVAHIRQERDLMPPREPALREAVQAEGEMVALPCLVDSEPEAVCLHDLGCDGHGAVKCVLSRSMPGSWIMP